MRDIRWDNIMLSEYRRLAILTEDEDRVLECWARNMTHVQIGLLCGMDERTVRSFIRRLRALYDQVQPYTPILPPRKKR